MFFTNNVEHYVFIQDLFLRTRDYFRPGGLSRHRFRLTSTVHSMLLHHPEYEDTMSDHFSGPRALAEPHGDITDVYAFPSPGQPGRLVLAMNVHPSAPDDASFSEALIFQLRVRPVTIAGKGPKGSFAVGEDEFSFRFSFAEATSRPSGRPATPARQLHDARWHAGERHRR